MIHLKGISQNIKKDSIILAKTTLISMAKESEKCDSLRVAYVLKSTSLRSLIETNTSIFKELKEERKQAEIIQQQLDKVNKQTQKEARKKRNKPILVTLIGFTGLIIGVVISN